MKLGTGITITFGTSGFNAEVLDIDVSGVQRPAVQSTHMSSQDVHEWLEGLLTDTGELEITIGFDPTNATKLPPIGWQSGTSPAKRESITITIPYEDIDATFVFDGFVTDFGFGAQIEEVMTGRVTVKIASQPTFTAGSDGA